MKKLLYVIAITSICGLFLPPIYGQAIPPSVVVNNPAFYLDGGNSVWADLQADGGTFALLRTTDFRADGGTFGLLRANDIQGDGGTFALLRGTDIRGDGGTFAALFANDMNADGGSFATLAVSQTVLPASDNNVPLGSTSRRFTDLFAGDIKDSDNVIRFGFSSGFDNGYRGNSTNSGSNIGNRFGNATTLTGSTRIACFYNDGLSTEKMCVFNNGAITPGPSTLGTCGTVPAGSILADSASGTANVPTRFCGCTDPGDGGTKYWRNLATGNAGNATTCPD